MTKPDGSEQQQTLINPPARDRGGRTPPFPDGGDSHGPRSRKSGAAAS
jgi:hypothetical protein